MDSLDGNISQSTIGTKLKKIPCFIVLGNHDHNLRSYIGVNPSEGIAVASNEVMHTYLNAEGKLDPAKIKYLSQSFLNLKTLLEGKYQWFLPNRFYEFTYKDKTFLMLDSNHIGEDFIEYKYIISNCSFLYPDLR